jgi:hypothetical protein
MCNRKNFLEGNVPHMRIFYVVGEQISLVYKKENFKRTLDL